jgi:hypothetical protein
MPQSTTVTLPDALREAGHHYRINGHPTVAQLLTDAAERIDALQADLEHIYRKVSHRCIDMTCPECDS